MSESATQTVQSQCETEVWQPPMPPTDLIFDDGEPLESDRHRILMNALIRGAKHQLSQQRTDYFCAGNMFVYFSSTQARNRDFRGPDFFVVLDVDGAKERQGWVVWEENGRYPDVIIELMSDSTRSNDLGKKKDIYAQTFRTPDYFVFDPFDVDSLQGWHLELSRGYVELNPNDRGWLWCESLGWWLGTWEGTLEDKSGTWLRFFDGDGNRILLPEEAAEAELERERQRSQILLDRLKAAGIDPDAIE